MQIIGPILDSIVAIAGKTKIEKGDFCVARVKPEKKADEFAGYVDPKKKKNDDEVVNSGSDQSHEGMELAMVVDKKHVVFGEVLEGSDVVLAMEEKGSPEGYPKAQVTVVGCGQL